MGTMRVKQLWRVGGFREAECSMEEPGATPDQQIPCVLQYYLQLQPRVLLAQIRRQMCSHWYSSVTSFLVSSLFCFTLCR